ncbi:MAG TPA: hypothetical protein VNN80_30330 [Polyangiaceae bacterium]|nr:hypothetical protein [Polyangiaceae bacterium]
MSQRNVELLIGRLLTDEVLRRRFGGCPRAVVADFCEQGWELSPGEVEALLAMDTKLWFIAAAGLPSRLQRCSLRSDD